MHASRTAHITCLVLKVQWFQVQFKVLILKFKALHCMWPGDLRDPLFPILSAWPIRSEREATDIMCQIWWIPSSGLSLSDIHLMGHSLTQHWVSSIPFDFSEVLQYLIMPSGLGAQGTRHLFLWLHYWDWVNKYVFFLFIIVCHPLFTTWSL